MAGFFGFEENHYDLSMEIGELVLFPAVRKAEAETMIALTGASCRIQVRDGTATEGIHPAEIMWQALDGNR